MDLHGPPKLHRHYVHVHVYILYQLTWSLAFKISLSGFLTSSSTTAVCLWCTAMCKAVTLSYRCGVCMISSNFIQLWLLSYKLLIIPALSLLLQAGFSSSNLTIKGIMEGVVWAELVTTTRH